MIPGGKEKVAKRILGFIVPEANKYECPNWILNNMMGMKGSTAERRLRDLRVDFSKKRMALWDDNPWDYPGENFGYRASKKQKNFWEFSPEFIEFLKEFKKSKEENR
jgi:hypothetical protein